MIKFFILILKTCKFIVLLIKCSYYSYTCKIFPCYSKDCIKTCLYLLI